MGFVVASGQERLSRMGSAWSLRPFKFGCVMATARIQPSAAVVSNELARSSLRDDRTLTSQSCSPQPASLQAWSRSRARIAVLFGLP